MNFENKTVLVTGATRGIGRATAEKFAACGATVIGTATSVQGAEKISQYLGHNGKGYVLDVTDSAAVEHVLKKITEQFGDIDVLVNNAGITADTLLLRMKDEDWLKVINTNLSSIFRMTKSVIRGMMKKRNGRIISVGSVVGSMGSPGQTNYSAAKAGIIGFTKSLSEEVAARGITVNVVSPGFIETDMTEILTAEQRAGILAMAPIGRLGKPEEVASAILFLASDGAGYITGETLHVNGGMYNS